MAGHAAISHAELARQAPRWSIIRDELTSSNDQSVNIKEKAIKVSSNTLQCHF